MHSGLLTQRITVKREQRTDDGAGGAATVWETVKRVRARVEAVKSAERAQHDRVQGIATYLITIRRPRTFDLRAEDRIEWNGFELSVSFIPPAFDTNQWVTFEATRGAKL